MLTDIIDMLVENSLLKKGEKVLVNAKLGRGVNIQVFPQNAKEFYNIRASKTNIEREFNGLVIANSVLGDHVPSPIVFIQERDINFIVSSGIRGRTVSHIDECLFNFINFYLTRTEEGFLEIKETSEGRISHREFLIKVSRFDQSKHLSELYHWLESERSSFIDRLPYVAQHGDFSLTNIRIRSDQERNRNPSQKYFVLDWEDFGRVLLPGFDVILFITSLLQYSPLRVNTVFSDVRNRKDVTEIGVRELIIRLRSSLSLSEHQYLDLVKVYMIVFLYLKRSLGYHPRTVQEIEYFVSRLPHLGKC
jgi:hypothetical protein